MALTQGKEAVVSDPIAALRDAYLNDRDPEEAVYGSAGTQEKDIPAAQEGSWEKLAESAGLGTEQNIAEQTEAQSEAPEVGAQVSVETPEQDLDVETLWVKGPNGTKQKIEVSYKDKEKIKQAYLKMAGMQKFRTERDLERASKAELEKKLAALSGDFDKLNSLFQEKGAKGLFEQLGGPGAFEKAIEEELAKREQLASMSPEEKMQLQYQEKEKSHLQEKSNLEKKYQEMLAKIEAEKEEASTKSLESKLVPAFDKYRYAGKLGDAVAESKIDKAIWREVMENLAELPDDTKLTSALIEKEFRTASSIYSKMVNSQVESKLKETVTKKKEDAAQRTQLAVKKGLASNTVNQEIEDDVKSGNWSSLLQKAFAGSGKL
jgi:hypothetical protein